MTRTRKDIATWADAHRRRLADPLGHQRLEHERVGLSWEELLDKCGPDELERSWRNHEAVRMLHEVERIGCKTRASILQEHIEAFDDEALPLDFWKRLTIAARDATLTPDKSMAADRDAKIRDAWPLFYSDQVRRWQLEDGDHPHKQQTARDHLAKKMHLTVSEVKRAVEKRDHPDAKENGDDFTRLAEKRLQVQKHRQK